MNAKERSPLCSDRKLRAITRVGQSVNIAVERFVTVGEAIADDSDDIRPQMYAACQEARAAGTFRSSIILFVFFLRPLSLFFPFVQKYYHVPLPISLSPLSVYQSNILLCWAIYMQR